MLSLQQKINHIPKVHKESTKNEEKIMQQNFNRAYSNKKSTMQMPTTTPSTKSATTKIQTIFFFQAKMTTVKNNQQHDKKGKPIKTEGKQNCATFFHSLHATKNEC